MLDNLADIWPVLLISFLIGFILSWLWELFFWRRRRAQIQADLQDEFARQLQAEIQDREGRLAHIEAKLQEQNEQLDIERERLAHAHETAQRAQARIHELEATRNSIAPPTRARTRSRESATSLSVPETQQDATASREPSPSTGSNELTLVKGIGPNRAEELRNAGITSLEQLAAMNEDSLARALGLKEWSPDRLRSWIDQARRFTNREGPAASGNIEEVAETAEGRPDNLAVIRGIGESIEQRLYNAGITSFRQLASLSPEELAEIVGRRGEFARWIEEARQRAQGN